MNCKRCQKEFEPKNSIQVFCSSKCNLCYNQLKWQQSHKKPCSQCPNLVKPYGNLCRWCAAKPRKIVFATMSLKELKKLNKHPRQWEGRIRTDARQLAGIGHSCFVCGYSKHFEVCHIKPIASFADEALVSEINSLSNLSILCRNCHWEQEMGLILVPSIASKGGFEPNQPLGS